MRGTAAIPEGRKRACYKSCVRPREPPRHPPPSRFVMKRTAPSLSNHALGRELAAAIAREDVCTAQVLDHIAEYDERRLYVPAGYPSMFAYCVEVLHRSEEAAYKRIRAARAARRFPVIFDMVADGRLHLSGVVLLAAYLTEHNASELLSLASHRTKMEIERLLAERFPRPDLPALVQTVSLPASPPPAADRATELELSPGTVARTPELSPGTVQAPTASTAETTRPVVKPLGPQRYAVQFTMSQSVHDKLRYVQELLSHQLTSGDIAQVFEQALDALIPQLEKRKFAAADRPRPGGRRSSASPRTIPAGVRRAVWKRDGGQCTYVSEDGHRCPARKFVEFDHVIEIARGGEAAVTDIRLRCRAHNQYAAERTFGADFMRHKRIAAAEMRVQTMAERAKQAANLTGS